MGIRREAFAVLRAGPDRARQRESLGASGNVRLRGL